MVRIIVPSMERSVPTNIPYRSERLASFRVESDIEAGEGIPSPLLLAKVRAAQLADLDAQEAVLKERWDIFDPKPAAPKHFHEEPKVASANPHPMAADRKAEQPASAAARPAPILVKPDGSPFPDGSTIAAAKRLCSSSGHKPLSGNVKERGVLSIAEWNNSMRFKGVPLCFQHLHAKAGR